MCREAAIPASEMWQELLHSYHSGGDSCFLTGPVGTGKPVLEFHCANHLRNKLKFRAAPAAFQKRSEQEKMRQLNRPIGDRPPFQFDS